MATLNSSQRSTLESAIIKARKLAENGARNALMAMAVDQAEPFTHLSTEQRELRRRLRNRARLLGDILEGKVQQINHLSYELAYEYWHKMLFAKFLESNGLLMHPQHGISVSLDDCEELAKEEKHADKWTAAAYYASRMLPAIFRTDDPLMQLDFSTEDRIALENLLAAIDKTIFTADDSLGWVYQFWQSEAKARINASGDKIDGEKLPAVTQLFTEPYMVHFLIDNTIGAWWVSRHPNEEPPVKFEYLRLLPDGTPASGKFEGWAATTASLTMLDPCMGSGHFVVATFYVLAKLRMNEEKLSAAEAAKKTIAENIFGLELDPRCTQIAAFNLALASWKFMGSYQPLPEMNLACSGIAPRGKKEDWIKLVNREKNAELKQKLENGMGELYDLFQKAPELGSLLDPTTIKGDAYRASFQELQPVLQKALKKEMELKNDEQAERGVMALGINQAAKILSNKFDLICTNVPYLGANKMGEILYDYSKNHHRAFSSDLATVFIDRITSLLKKQGAFSIVSPQNWLSISSFKNCRKSFLDNCSIAVLSGLGINAFRTLMYQFHVILMIGQNKNANASDNYALVDLSYSTENSEKEFLIKSCEINLLSNKLQLKNPDYRILLNNIQLTSKGEKLLSEYAFTSTGLQSFDKPRFNFYFWEITNFISVWKKCQTSSKDEGFYGGSYDAVRWESGKGQLYEYVELMAANGYSSGIWKAGSQFWNMKGISVSLIGSIKANIYLGEAFDTNVGVVVPKKEEYYLPLFYFLRSNEFLEKVRALDKKLMITNATLGKVSLDIEKWKGLSASELTIPTPFSYDPTQWIFNGDLLTAEDPLQVGVARLLGYHYPEQPADEILDIIEDEDGIVCIPSVNGEPAAADRLREFLKAAYGTQWSNHTIEELLKQTGVTTTNLETWLRESFFEQHFKLFHHRPFIWHIWDGRKDGFGVLVNYHKLSKENLQKIIFTYLGDWLRQCEAKVRNNESGAEGLLSAAKELKKKLELILEGETPHDIFIRWKPLHQQPIGWEPDINDGVRLNIRPFMEANILRKKPNIKWEKDRGKNPPGSPWGENRINDKHLTLAEKREAKEKFEKVQQEKAKKKTPA